MKKVLLVDCAKCTGCETCVDVCSGRKAGVYSEKSSRIRVRKDEMEATFIPLVCEQCREHPCTDVCPVEAIQYEDELSIFRVDEDSCTGCGACEEACPYGGIFVSDGLALKCDLCGGEPACVSVCYPRALQFVEVTEEAILADLGHKMDKLQRIRSNLHE
jgi:carbon-monoxide dehydrogenase iron sulfur subunit